MEVVRTREELAAGMEALRREGRVAFVPTMGFLHEGHLSLVDVARGASEAVAVSIFVNPLQFGPSEDLEAYPRDEERDRSLLEERGADLVFIPTVEEMYPGGRPAVTVDPGPMAELLCGAYRPGHFRGVLTVVARLFGLLRPDAAVFGRKDYQQAVLVERMVADLELGVEVLTAPIVREEDGLALSSRNVYLDDEERRQATSLYEALLEARRRFRQGERSAGALAEGIRRRIDERPAMRVQYAELVHPATLERVDVASPGTVAAVAAFCGTTRLIDNLTLE